MKKNKLLHIEEYALILIIGLMTALTFINVFCRYLLNYGFAWTEEIVTYSFVWASMLGFSLCCLYGVNMGMDAIVRMVPKKLQIADLWFCTVLTCGVLAVMAYYGWDRVTSQFKYESGTAILNIPMWIFSISVPICAVLSMVRTVQTAVAHTRSATKAEEDQKGEAQ